ncbi:MAG: hypothetical protein LW863_10505, partial [Flammeovirgaceae bacterium]|nr:hypothetical protein [Flammeovirgaceae bacterium]
WNKRVGVLDELLTYDHNGNILTLQRNQNNRGLMIGTTSVTVNSAIEAVDNLTYSYTTNTNQMLSVEDAAPITTGKGIGDFKNGATITTEYTYNTDGSMTADKNKGIDSIKYNVLGKPYRIKYADGKLVTYVYDAAGNKLKMVAIVAGTTTTTDYVGGFVYTNNALSFFSSPEGRVVKNGSNYEYQYAIADHQGNTRVLFTGAPVVKQQVTASFETGAEASNFRNYPNTSGINVIASNNTTAGGTKSQHLNGGYMGMVGVSKDYHVYPGDSVKISAKARYDAPTTNASSLSTQFATVLLNAFGLQPPPGGEVGTRAAALNNWGITAAGGYANGTGNDGYINAYVNIIIFDKNYKLIEFKAVPVTSSSTPTLISTGYLVKEEGYAFLYISNEQPVETSVYFDDVTFMYKPTSIVQYNEYYPFGLQTANSWMRENNTGNNYLFNGGTELNTTTGVMDLFYRNYDPALGRMNQVDPMAGMYAAATPYNYAFNSPVVMNDPLGDDSKTNGKAYCSWCDRGAGSVGGYDPMTGRIMDNGTAGGSPTAGRGIYRESNGDLTIDFNQIGQYGGHWSSTGGYYDYTEAEAWGSALAHAKMFGINLNLNNPGIKESMLRMIRGVGSHISNIYQTAIRNNNTYASNGNTMSPSADPSMIALALYLRYMPSLNTTTPNPWYFAEAAYIDGGLNIVGFENDRGIYLVMVGQHIGEIIGYKEDGHGLGSDVTAQVEYGRVDYTGNKNDFDPESHLAGNRDKFYFGVLFVGFGISTSVVDKGTNMVWTTSLSLGLGASVLGPISTGVNTGKIRLNR